MCYSSIMNEMNEAASTESKVYEIPVENMDALLAKLEKLTKRAAKLGCEAIRFSVVGEKMVEVHTTNVEDVYDSEDRLGFHPSAPKTHFEKRILVTVSGVAPKMNGWSIAAVIEHTEGGNI